MTLPSEHYGGPSTLILLGVPSIRPVIPSIPLHIMQLVHDGPVMQGSAPGQTLERADSEGGHTTAETKDSEATYGWLLLPGPLL